MLANGLLGFVVASMVVALAIGCERREPQSQTAAPQAQPVATRPAKPLIPRVEMADWCKEHGVPESICTRCNDELTAGFKGKGDWCQEHDLPDSQCFICHPELKAEFEAMAPKG
jgi:hypothetical protein